MATTNSKHAIANWTTPLIYCTTRIGFYTFWCIHNLITCNWYIIKKTLDAFAVFQVFTNLTIFVTLASSGIKFFTCVISYWFFKLTLTLIIVKLHFLPSNSNLHSHEIGFTSVFHSFIPLIILNTVKFTSSILLGTHILPNGYPVVLQI